MWTRPCANSHSHKQWRGVEPAETVGSRFRAPLGGSRSEGIRTDVWSDTDGNDDGTHQRQTTTARQTPPTSGVRQRLLTAEETVSHRRKTWKPAGEGAKQRAELDPRETASDPSATARGAVPPDPLHCGEESIV